MPKLTTKRQVTIPQSICQKLGFEPGDFIRVFERDGVAHLVKMNCDDLSGTIKCAYDTHQSPAPGDIKQAIKEKASRKFRGE